MIKSNEKEFIRNWHQHKVALTRENTRIKQPIRDGEITYDQSDISHLASGLPSGIDNLVRSGSNLLLIHFCPISVKIVTERARMVPRWTLKRLIKEREDKRVAQSPSAPEFHQSIPSQPILHQTLSYGWVMTSVKYKQKQENKCPLRCASLRGVEFFPHGKRGEKEGAALGTFVLLFIFNTK